jgi:hypothetical protein
MYSSSQYPQLMYPKFVVPAVDVSAVRSLQHQPLINSSSKFAAPAVDVQQFVVRSIAS